MKRLSTLSLTKSEPYGKRVNNMKYTQIKDNKRVANPKASWLKDGLNSYSLFRHIESILTDEMKFVKTEHDFSFVCLRKSIGNYVFGTKNHFINIYLEVDKNNNKLFLILTSNTTDRHCILMVEDFNSKNPCLITEWEGGGTSHDLIHFPFGICGRFDPNIHKEGAMHEYRFIDSLLDTIRTLWDMEKE